MGSFEDISFAGEPQNIFFKPFGDTLLKVVFHPVAKFGRIDIDLNDNKTQPKKNDLKDYDVIFLRMHQGGRELVNEALIPKSESIILLSGHHLKIKNDIDTAITRLKKPTFNPNEIVDSVRSRYWNSAESRALLTERLEKTKKQSVPIRFQGFHSMNHGKIAGSMHNVVQCQLLLFMQMHSGKKSFPSGIDSPPAQYQLD